MRHIIYESFDKDEIEKAFREYDPDIWESYEKIDFVTLKPVYVMEMWKRKEKVESKETDNESCEFCYYEHFDSSAYPCSRCVCNAPTANMFRPKMKQTEKRREK